MARTDSITVGVGQYEADLILEPLKIYAERYPEVEVNCMHYAYSNLVSFWASGTLDVAIAPNSVRRKFRSKASVVSTLRPSGWWLLIKIVLSGTLMRTNREAGRPAGYNHH